MSRPGLRWLRASCLFSIGYLGTATYATAQEAPSPANVRQQSTIDARDKTIVAARMYMLIRMYFAHWRAVPQFRLDDEFRKFVSAISDTTDRKNFDFSCMEFMALLRNGHSGFDDDWLDQTLGQPLGFTAQYIDAQWVVTRSRVSGLRIGDVVESIDAKTTEDFFNSVKRYLPASSETAARRSLFETPVLFPKKFQIHIADSDRAITIERIGKFKWAGTDDEDITVSESAGILYLRIPGFWKPEFEEHAMKAISEHRRAGSLIIDVRDNHGGSSPSDLVRTLMDRPYRFWNESTPFVAGALDYKGELGKHADLYWTSETHNPNNPTYSGPVFILADSGCRSACEDFIVPFKDNGRAVILGENTQGSSGQPYGIELGVPGMGAGVGTKREYFPDGSEFEGLGIKPDVDVRTTAEDLRSGRDPVRQRAQQLALTRKAGH